MAAPRKSAAARGLGWAHQQQAERLKKHHIDGTPCWWCGKPMWLDRTHNWDYNPTSTHPHSGTLQADHSRTRAQGGTIADRLLHATCNGQRGDGSRDHLRPALGGTIPTPADDRAAWCRMDW